jgi:ferrous iron transport protein A
LVGKEFEMVLAEIKQDGKYHVKRITGDAKLHAHLEDLGFVPGAPITVVSRSGKNTIVNVKGSRVAIGYDLARAIMV